jgi:hypothetical protein
MATMANLSLIAVGVLVGVTRQEAYTSPRNANYWQESNPALSAVLHKSLIL